jgi:uncharacterized protein (PEP-CTERM system associated)
LLAAWCWLASGGPAPAQGLPTTAAASPTLPATGTDVPGANVRVGDLRQQLERAFANNAPASPAGPAWTFKPALDLQEQWTDDIQGARTGSRQSGFITTVTPSLLINGDTPRLRVNLAYAPTAYIYASHSNQDRIAQNLNADALATLVPGTLFLDLRGFATTQSRFAGSAPNGSTTLNRQNLVQIYNFSASPYLQHRFGGVGTGEIGYAISRTIQDNSAASEQPVFLAGSSTPLFLPTTNQNLTTQTEHAAFTSGEDFGRLLANALASGTQYDGNGVLRSAYRYLGVYESGYALTRRITLLGRIGYEDIHYSGLPQTHIQDAVWSFGTHLVPNPDSSITLRYGHQDGFNDFRLDGVYAPTARTRIYANYSDALTTGLQTVEEALALSTTDPFGNLVDRSTGAPIAAVSNFFGTQGSDTLVRQKLFSLTASLLLARDTLSATFTSRNQKVVAVAADGNGGGGPASGTFGSLTWSHQLRERLQSSLFLQYGQSRNAGPPSSTSQPNTGQFVATATLGYLISPTLTGTLLYSHTNNSYARNLARTAFNASGQGRAANLVLVGLHKGF